MESSKMYCPSRSGMEICETSGLPIPMVPCLHQSNGYNYVKGKLRVWSAQKCIVLVGEEIVLTCAGPQTTLFHGGQYRDGMEICETSGLPIGMLPRLYIFFFFFFFSITVCTDTNTSVYRMLK